MDPTLSITQTSDIPPVSPTANLISCLIIRWIICGISIALISPAFVFLHSSYWVDFQLQKNPHDDVIKWKHFPRYWPFPIHRWIPPQRPMMRSFDVCFDLRLNKRYSIHVPGWLQKWLNLITAPGSVSNEPGSVTWLATKNLKTVSWRNHTKKLTIWWAQNISFWLKINISSSYFSILMLNCLENTLKLQFDSYVTAVRFLT